MSIGKDIGLNVGCLFSGSIYSITETIHFLRRSITYVHTYLLHYAVPTLLTTFSTFCVGDMCALCLWPTYLCIYAFKSVGNQSILHLLETPYQISTVNCLIFIYENGRQTDCLAKLDLKWKSTFLAKHYFCKCFSLVIVWATLNNLQYVCAKNRPSHYLLRGANYMLLNTNTQAINSSRLHML